MEDLSSFVGLEVKAIEFRVGVGHGELPLEMGAIYHVEGLTVLKS